MVSNRRYEEQANFYDKEIERIKEDRDFWRDRFYEHVTHAAEADIYKSILVKQGVLGEANRYSDEVFMFEGKIYKPISYHLDIEPNRSDSLSVEFVKVKEV